MSKNRKNTGSYYTPQVVADFIVDRIFKQSEKQTNLNILEPSCGDGVFIKSFIGNRKVKRISKINLDLVEINTSELHKAVSLTKNQDCIHIKSHNEDFLVFQKKSKKKYDVVIGNPPYLTKKYLSKSQFHTCINIHRKAGLPETVNNIWTSFLIAGASLLNENGIQAFVLPGEFMRVKFTENLKIYLLNYFARIEIFSFKELIFKGVGQDTIIFIAYKTSDKPGLYFTEVDNPESLKKNKFSLRSNKRIGTFSRKWSYSILPISEIDLLDKIRSEMEPVRHYCDVCAGIVTAANQYFILDSETLKSTGMKKYALPILQRGLFANGRVVFEKDDFRNLNDEGFPCHLLLFNRLCEKSILPDRVTDYLKKGEKEGIHNRHKCQRRKPWYKIPSIWASEAFFVKRCHWYPKLLKNTFRILVTDSSYRVNMKAQYSNMIDSLIFSYYNSFTLSLAELEGRYYGGGVLELTPNEFKRLPVPFKTVTPGEFKAFSKKFERKNSIEEILNYTDDILLKKHLKLSSKHIERLQNLRKRLVTRRLQLDNSVK